MSEQERRTVAESIAWEGVPERAESEVSGCRVWSCGLAQVHQVRLLDSFVGVWLHWDGKRSRPCLGDACEQCKGQHAPARWKGYAPALLVQRNLQTGASDLVRIVLELTEVAAAKLQGKECRGLLVRLERRGNSRNAPVQLTVADRQPLDEPPPAWDVKPILLRLWGLQGRAGAAPIGEPAEAGTEAQSGVIPFRKHA